MIPHNHRQNHMHFNKGIFSNCRINNFIFTQTFMLQLSMYATSCHLNFQHIIYIDLAEDININKLMNAFRSS